MRCINFGPGASLTPGKAEYIPDCLCRFNIDLARGCPSKIDPLSIRKPVPEQLNYTPEGCIEEIVERYHGRCGYCYSLRNNGDKPIPIELNTHTLDTQLEFLTNPVKYLEERVNIRRDDPLVPHMLARIGMSVEDLDKSTTVRYLRLGKRTECGYNDLHLQMSSNGSSIRSNLYTVLNWCLANGITPIFPTKFLDEDDLVASLLRETNASLQFSIGKDKLEPGAVANGFTTDRRIQVAEWYKSRGVNVMFRLVADITRSPFEINYRRTKEANEPHVEALKVLANPEIPTLITPLRIWGRLTPRTFIGMSLEELQMPDDQLSFDGNQSQNLYSYVDKWLLPSHIDPFWQRFIEERKMCAHLADGRVICDGCGTGLEGRIISTEAVTNHSSQRPHRPRIPKRYSGKSKRMKPIL